MPHGNLDHTVTRIFGFAPSSGNAGPPERQDLADGKLPLIPPLHVYLAADANRAVRLAFIPP